MTYKQSLKVAMFLRISLFFKKYDDILKLFLFLYGVIGDFQTANTSIQPTLEKQAADSKGLTKSKEQALAEVVAQLLPICRKAFAWAKVKKNEVLKSLFNIHKDSFNLSSPSQDDLTLINNLLLALNENATDLLEVNITQLQLDAVEALGAVFKKTLGTPQKAIKDSSAATLSLEEEILLLTDLEETCYDLLVNEYNITNHEMVLLYETNRKIGSPVKTHTTVLVNVYEDAAKTIPVKDADVTIVERERTEVTDFHGMAEIVQFHGGKLTLLVKAKGHPDKELPFQIKNGEHIEIDIVLS